MPAGTPGAIDSARALEQRLNGEVTFVPDQVIPLAAQYKVYIFNVGPLAHKVDKGSAGKFDIPECPVGAEYGDPLILPSVCSDSYIVENEMKTHSVTGEFMAQDIVHPMIGTNWSFGQNLDDFGVFWTKSEKPTAEELAGARGRMEKTFRKLLEVASGIETKGTLDEITPLMRIAATYFGQDRAWNKIYKRLEECPGCGEAVKPGLIVHRPCGYVFDPDRALVAGMITVEQHGAMRAAMGKPVEAPEPKKGRKG